MHPIISAALADARHDELLRLAARERRLRSTWPELRRASRTPAPVRVPACAALLRGWLARG